jgi:hypothetical protein
LLVAAAAFIAVVLMRVTSSGRTHTKSPAPMYQRSIQPQAAPVSSVPLTTPALTPVDAEASRDRAAAAAGLAAKEAAAAARAAPMSESH